MTKVIEGEPTDKILAGANLEIKPSAPPFRECSSQNCMDQNTYFFGQSDHYSHKEQMVYEEGYTQGWNFVQPSAPPLEWSSLEPLKTNEFAHRKNVVQHDDTCRFRTYLSFFLSLSIIVLATLAIILHLLVLPLLISCLVVCVMYYLENCLSSTMQYLNNFYCTEEAINIVSMIRETAPRFKFKISCYHYETYIETYTDSDGETQTRTETRTVYTHSAKMDYFFDLFKDVTKLPAYEYPTTKVHLIQRFGFEDDYTRRNYESEKTAFIRRNDRDDHYDFHEERSVPGFVDRMLVETIPGATDKYFTVGYFCLAIITLLAPCYRNWFLSNTGKENVAVTKIIQKLPQNYFIPNLNVNINIQNNY